MQSAQTCYVLRRVPRNGQHDEPQEGLVEPTAAADRLYGPSQELGGKSHNHGNGGQQPQRARQAQRGRVLAALPGEALGVRAQLG